MVQTEKFLFVTDRDLDKAATENAKSALQRGEIPPSFAKDSDETRRQVQSGEQALFTLRIIDIFEEDGDAVSIFLDGVPYGEIQLSHSGATLTLALKRNAEAHLRIVATHDGGGGVTFGAASSLGEVLTRVMAVGDSEEWTISCK